MGTFVLFYQFVALLQFVMGYKLEIGSSVCKLTRAKRAGLNDLCAWACPPMVAFRQLSLKLTKMNVANRIER